MHRQLVIVLVPVLMVLPAAEEACGAQKAGLVGYWPFDGNGDSIVGKTAVPHGAFTATADRSGKKNSAVQFNANKRGYFSILQTGSGQFNRMESATISLWARWDAGTQTGQKAYATYAAILGRQRDGSFSTHLLGLSGTDPSSAGVRWRSVLQQDTILSAAAAVGVGRWHHIAVTYHPKGQTLYVDGKAVARTNAAPRVTNLGGEVPLTVGGWTGAGNTWSSATVDDLAIWSKDLSAVQIALLAKGKMTPLEVIPVSQQRLTFADAAEYSSLDHTDVPREHIKRNPLEALKFARDTLELVEKSAKRPELRKRLDQIEKETLALIKSGSIDLTGKSVAQIRAASRALAEKERELAGLKQSILKLRREIIFSHPLLDFEKLLINKRPPPAYSHMTRQYLGRYSRPGPGLAVLESWKEDPRLRPLTEGKLPVGSVLHPDLSFDAKRVLFSFCDHTPRDRNFRRFVLYEIGVDGGGLRQITGLAADALVRAGNRKTTLIEDWDPCYLPDGGIAFVSTRLQAHIRCQYGGRYFANFVLYRADGDPGAPGNIRRVSFNEAGEWEPSLLDDGRLVYTRWDYVNRHFSYFQSLWVTRPDGTATAHVYGNYTRNPCMTGEPRLIPGSHKIVSTAMAHHGYTAGSLVVIDAKQGLDGLAPLTRITPEISFPETEAWPKRGAYCNPYPLSEDLFLVAYTSDPLVGEGRVQRPAAYGIYLLDSLGGLELIYRDAAMSCLAPIPIKPRPKPPALPSLVESKLDKTMGTFYVGDVYQSAQPIPPGSVKSLRVVRMYAQTIETPPSRGKAIIDMPRRILGTVPVGKDGAVAFRAPVGQPLLFQLLDENGMSVMSMRSAVYLQPGEVIGCAGCHEPHRSTPRSVALPKDVKVHDLKPPAGPRYEGGLSFVRTVQPVLDRYCIQCHGLDKTEGKINLLGRMKKVVFPYPRWPGPNRMVVSNAYESLVNHPGLVKIAQCNFETDYTTPRDYFAHAGSLAKMLLAGHPDKDAKARVKLDRASFQRVVDWLDVNAIFYGDYSWNKAEWRKASPPHEAALRRHIGNTFGPKLAAQPFESLVNVAEPSESRILKAPLATSGGGWGQITKGGWRNTDEPGYRKMRQLVEAAIAPPEFHDIAGTCGRDKCVCRTCWVRHAVDKRRKQTTSGKPKP